MSKKNVVLIVIDCLRPDFLGRGFSPTIDQLSKDGLVFTNAFANGPFSPASYVSMITSKSSLDFNSISKYPIQAISLCEELKCAGYKTSCFSSNAWISPHFGYDVGFDHFEDFLEKRDHAKKKNLFGRLDRFVSCKFGCESFLTRLIKQLEHVKNLFKKIERREASKVIEKASRWVKSNKEGPFFIWLIFMDVHAPHFPPKNYITKLNYKISEFTKKKVNAFVSYKLNPEDIEVSKKLYSASLLYVDSEIKKFVDLLKELGIYEDTVIIITADHGYEFGEHNGSGAKAKMYDELLHVPLIFANVRKGINNVLVSLKDLPKTILELLNLNSSNFEGRNILRAKTDDIIYSECAYSDNLGPVYLGEEEKYKKNRLYSIRTRKWKYIKDFGKNTEELYDLGEDPEEKNNLNEEDVLKKFRQILENHMSAQDGLKIKLLDEAISDVKI